MFALVVRFMAKEGKEKEIERHFHEMAEKVRLNEKETLNFDLHRSLDDPAEFIIYERYPDRNALQTSHVAMPYFKEFMAVLQSYVEGEMQVTHCDVVEAK